MAFVKTELGQEVLKNRTVALSPRQRAMLIMADGSKDGAQLLALTAGMGTTIEDLTDLVVKGLIGTGQGAAATKPSAPPAAPAPAAKPTAPAPVAPPPVAVVDTPEVLTEVASAKPADYKTAYIAGLALTSGLGFRGFRLNMSMESASNVDEIKSLRPQLLEKLTSAHGEAKARDLLREFDRALGLR
jgi:hypothetical protein